MKIIDESLLKTLLAEAEKSPRRRAHHNLHASLDEPIHRLLVATMPDTVFPTHRHSGGKWELLTVLRGEIEVTVYETDGAVIQTLRLIPGGVSRVTIPGIGDLINPVGSSESTGPTRELVGAVHAVNQSTGKATQR